jgi:hypothetical protein
VAELVDALASGASGLTAVKVRVLSWAPPHPFQAFGLEGNTQNQRLEATRRSAQGAHVPVAKAGPWTYPNSGVCWLGKGVPHQLAMVVDDRWLQHTRTIRWVVDELARAVTAALQRTSVRGPTFSVGICNGHRETTTARRAEAVVTIPRTEPWTSAFNTMQMQPKNGTGVWQNRIARDNLKVVQRIIGNAWELHCGRFPSAVRGNFRADFKDGGS